MIEIKNLNLSFGEKIIFRNLNLRINDNSRIAVVGANGAGKTTLFRVIMGQLSPDSGNVERSKNLTVGCLPQDLVELQPLPLMQYLKNSAGISNIESKLRSIEEKLSLTQENHDGLLKEHSRLE